MIDEIINDLQKIADRKCYPEDILDGSIAQEWVDYIVDLQQENKQLKEDKKKAIEYIQNHQPVFQLNTKKQLEEMYYEFYQNILEILGDKECPKGYKSYKDYKKKEEAFVNYFCKGDKENE